MIVQRLFYTFDSIVPVCSPQFPPTDLLVSLNTYHLGRSVNREDCFIKNEFGWFYYKIKGQEKSFGMEFEE